MLLSVPVSVQHILGYYLIINISTVLCFCLFVKNLSSLNYNGCSNGYNGTACHNGAESKQGKKFPDKPTNHLPGSTMSHFRQSNGDGVPAVVSSGSDDLVNLDDLRVAIQQNNVSAVERILSFGKFCGC